MRQSNELIAQSEAPLFHKLDSEVMPYVFTETRVYTWPSRIEGGKLITDAGQQYLDLGEEVHPLQAIAEHLVAQETRDAPRQPAELARKLDDLRKLNPTLKNMEKCSGRIEIGKAPAFVAHPEHRWTMQ